MSISRLRNIKVLTDSNKKRYYKPLKYPEIPLSVADIYIITSNVDRLDNLAHRFYDNPELWWIIAAANPGIIKGDGFGLKSNLLIIITNNPQAIIQTFQSLNR